MKISVLLVDDEQQFVCVLAKRLQMRGYDATFAIDGRRAIEMATQRRYDVIVLDVKMPGIGGIELMAELTKTNPKARYIFVTGHGSPDDFEAGSSRGCAYLSKPVDITTLIETMQRCLQEPSPEKEHP